MPRTEERRTIEQARGTLRPGGRTEKVRRQVVDVVFKLIKAGNIEFTVQDVARLSGVHRTTIYGRWPDRASLLSAALAEHSSKLRVELCGDWERDLLEIGLALRDFHMNPFEQIVNSLLASTAKSDLSAESNRLSAALIDMMSQPIQKAKDKGKVRAEIDPSIVIGMLESTIVATIVLAKRRPENKFITSIVRHLVLACAVPGNFRPSKSNKGGLIVSMLTR